MTAQRPSPPTGPALVTGATSGLGRATALALAARGWNILVHGRDKTRCDEVVAEIRAAGGSASPYLADLSSLGRTAAMAEQVASDYPSLSLLLNNAGVGFGADTRYREVSKDGYELRLAVNYLAPVVLTKLLRAPLRAGGGQVVNVGSIGQSPPDFDDLQFIRRYEGSKAYMRSKFALAAFTFAMAEEYLEDGIRVNCLHPGTYLDTGMTREAGINPWSTVQEGVDAVLRVIEAGQNGTTGHFFDGSRPTRAHQDAYAPKVRQRLRALTGQLLIGVEGAEKAVW
ncbi:3-oxoacyl-ACP reductase [Sphaerisporangium melleum]|uniref:3-oxoacyl-ACP reductase n=1 Tax=Sphaerisporangium melleum TaxID=321316 RepID=A0A917R318_9ACTN|nr:SDR family NAD(P)-dependent oxidoreductase [Sphaerisporangium melleum]GGK87796.1 3-oxoacyl-ACP reductase [Sphaerisporangium melleum]GII72444.1 3-oxoacyl-ACP reductase [Sphaerisporangium melleum]